MCGHYIQGSGFNRRSVAETCVVYLFIDLQCIGNTCHLNIFEVHWSVQCLVKMYRKLVLLYLWRNLCSHCWDLQLYVSTSTCVAHMHDMFLEVAWYSTRDLQRIMPNIMFSSDSAYKFKQFHEWTEVSAIISHIVCCHALSFFLIQWWQKKVQWILACHVVAF